MAWASLLVLGAAAIATGAFATYVRGWRRLQRASPEEAAGLRPWAFASGLLVALLVVGSPLSALDHELLTLHMLQHLLLVAIAAPLLMAGEPPDALRSRAPRPAADPTGTAHR